MNYIICSKCGDKTYYRDMQIVIQDGWVSVIDKEGKPCYLCPDCADSILKKGKRGK